MKFAVISCFAVVVCASAAQAQVQTRDQQRCVVALDKAAAKVADAQAKLFLGCLKNGARGKLASVGQTLEQCVAADAGGRVAKARAGLAAAATKQCASAPTFGPTAASLDAAFAALVDMRAVFGNSIDSAVIDSKTDKRGAACQFTVAKGALDHARVRIREAAACIARGLKDGTITSPVTLGACIGADPNGKVAAALAKAQRNADKKCAAPTDVATTLPGACAGMPLAGLFDCIGERVACDVCLGLRAGERAAHACHRFANGVATSYCGAPPVTTQSIARQWDEQLLGAIRVDTPRPTVHARNLFHLSAAMYDAFLAYGAGGADPYLTHESPATNDAEHDREIAISFAAYRLLKHRFQKGPGTNVSQAAFLNHMADLGFDPDFASTVGDVPAAVGNRIGEAMIQYGLADGSNEANDYADDTGYAPLNEPLVVKGAGTTMANPNHWQPLALDVILTQNGIPLPDKIQTYISPNWNDVKPFALTRDDPNDVYIDPGPPPQLGSAAFRDQAVALIRMSSDLDASDPTTIDLSPAVHGHNTLGTNDGSGWGMNPVTGQPYPSNVVKRGDWARALAEFWADGPKSETPPGHWNVIANAVSDDPSTVKRFGGSGPVLSDLEWDVKLYFALNGAVHDAAVTAWGLKRKYDGVRPISMIRYMGGLGQSSDPMGPSYDPNGLPLEPGLIEVITPQSAAPGQRHANLAAFVGDIAVRSWPGQPADPKTQASGAVWERAKTWVPYQRSTFVTPAFPGFISGHSTFSRAAATVLEHFTGSPYFPGGLGTFTVHAGGLGFELGPTTDVTFQWASYSDACDEAGVSRLWGGIHVAADDFTGRILGAEVGEGAFELAAKYFDGTAVP